MSRSFHAVIYNIVFPLDVNIVLTKTVTLQYGKDKRTCNLSKTDLNLLISTGASRRKMIEDPFN